MTYPKIGGEARRAERLRVLIERDQNRLFDLKYLSDYSNQQVRHAIRLCERRIARNSKELQRLS